jgi:hypothetical protein
VHINIIDVLDTWDSDLTPTLFESKDALASYTKANSKFFIRKMAKQDHVLQVLLRKLV